MQKSSHFRAGGIRKYEGDDQAIADAVLRDISLRIYQYDEPLEAWENEGGSVED